MTIPRVVALAQALAMIMILVPGPQATGPVPALAAIAPPQPGGRSDPVLSAVGSGIGCEAGTDRFKGPRTPGKPPWPPGAEPTPTPAPSLEAAASQVPGDAGGEPEPTATDSPQGSVGSATAAGDVATTFLAATGIRVAQVDSAAQPSPTPLPQSGPEAPASAGPDEGQPAAGASSAAATPAPPEASLYVSGIDVSHHNGDVDFGRVRDAGYEFVFLKTTQDNDFIDPMFTTNLARARAAGLATGGYHFFDYTLDGRVQADHFVDRLEATGGLADALPPVVDVECFSPIGLSIHAVSTARLRDLVERIYERTGRMPIVYTSVFMWKEVVGNAEGFEGLPLWAACWDCETPPSIAPGWEAWTFWQTGIDRIPGVGSLDGNYFSGDPEDLDALRLRPLAIEAGAAATASQEVEIDLGGRSGTHMRTSPDGRTWSRWTPIRGTPRAELGSTEGSHTLHVQLRDGPKLKSPVFSDAITLDTSGPQLSTPTIRLRLAPLGEGAAAISEAADVESAIASQTADAAATIASAPSSERGGAGAGIPIEVGWEASDAVAGLSDASLSIACDGDRAASIDAPGSAEAGQLMTWSAPAVVAPDARCRVTVTGRDGVGNATRARADTVVATVIAAAGDGSSGASVEGQQVGVIARRGPDLGRAAVLVDGEAVGLVDLYAPMAGEVEVVHVVDLVPGRPASITLEATGTSDPDSRGTTIAIDGFVTLASD